MKILNSYKCINGCTGTYLIPRKVVIRKTNVVIEARCGKCKWLNRIELPFKTRHEWLYLLQDDIYRCNYCGAINNENFKIIQTNVSFTMTFFNEVLSTMVFKCNTCGKLSKKAINSIIWSELKEANEKELERPFLKSEKELTCPNCGAISPPNSIYCQICGFKIKEIPNEETLLFCDNCGAPLRIGARFCSECGNKIIS
ncbi:MAG: zinc ribbon domain-containing protein [Candidatus Helarchaeota archaeon]